MAVRRSTILKLTFATLLLAFAASSLQTEDKGTIIGIDLGTTYSCVAAYRNGIAEIIPNEQGNRITPSYVAFGPEGERLVGDAAKNQATQNHQNTIYDAKRLIGRKFSEQPVQDALKHMSYKIVESKDKPQFKVNVGADKLQSFTPEEISAMVLTKMKQIAEEYLGEKVTHAVVTVPAYFNDAQRAATKDAGTIAGLTVERVLNEPTAAALAYGLDKLGDSSEKTILVFDLGGGTFDVSLLTVDAGVFEVLSTNGNTHLGGEDFDQRIIDHLVKRFKQKTGHDVRSDKRALQKLRREAEMAKRKLSAAHQTTIEIEDFYNGADFSDSLTRAKFEELNADLFKKTLEPLRQVLADAEIEKSEVDEIVLVGGSTRIPKIQKMVKEFFGKEVAKGVNPDEAVAHGAAIQGCIMRGGCGDKIDEILVLDVTPLTLGIETVGGVMTEVIKKGSTVPVKKSQIFSTASDNQKMVTIQVGEGQRAMMKDNHFLGKFDLSDIEAAPRGVPQIEVTFEVDVNGILRVTAVDKASSNEQSIKINQNDGRLTDEEIQRMQDEGDKFAEEDAKLKERVEALNSLEGFAHKLKHDLNSESGEMKDKLSEEDKQSLAQAADDAIEWLESNKEADTSEFKDKLQDLQNTVQSVLKDSEGKDEL